MQQTKKFQKRKEDFICEHCGEKVVGDGYTNHCPHCLWSKHVDINPGDRAETCRGMMEPIAVLVEDQEYKIIHKCTECGAIRRNKRAENDSFETILDLAGNPIPQTGSNYRKSVGKSGNRIPRCGG